MIFDKKTIILRVNNIGVCGRFKAYTKEVRVKGNKRSVRAFIRRVN